MSPIAGCMRRDLPSSDLQRAVSGTTLWYAFPRSGEGCSPAVSGQQPMNVRSAGHEARSSARDKG